MSISSNPFEQYDSELLVEEGFYPTITATEATSLKLVQKRFMESYIQNRENIPVEMWLPMEIKANLPELSDVEAADISREIIESLNTSEEKQHSLNHAIQNGRSKESWFSSEIQKTASYMSTQEAAQYLQTLDQAVNSANEALHSTILTEAGVVNLNPNLDGFIAEQYHAQTFNLNAEATGSQYRAKVLQSNGKGYKKNSVDVVIEDVNGRVVRRYQSKYCKDAEATAKAFEAGDYRGQQKLVPQEQQVDIQRKSTIVIEAPDGTTSNPLSKQAAKDLQNEAQSGRWNDLNWNSYQAKDVLLGIGRQAGQAALMGAAIGAGTNIVEKVWQGEKIDGGEILDAALLSGADFGIKAATAGALKVGAEKGLIGVIPKGTPAGTIANIAHVAVENGKIIQKVISKQLTLKEGIDKMEQTTVATVTGIAVSAKGAVLGATIGAVLGPVGATVGGLVGGAIGYMSGSKAGEMVVTTRQEMRESVKDFLKTSAEAMVHTFSAPTRLFKSWFC